MRLRDGQSGVLATARLRQITSQPSGAGCRSGWGLPGVWAEELGLGPDW